MKRYTTKTSKSLVSYFRRYTDIFFGPGPDDELFKLKPHKRSWILQSMKRLGDYYFWKYNTREFQFTTASYDGSETEACKTFISKNLAMCKNAYNYGQDPGYNRPSHCSSNDNDATSCYNLGHDAGYAPLVRCHEVSVPPLSGHSPQFTRLRSFSLISISNTYPRDILNHNILWISFWQHRGGVVKMIQAATSDSHYTLWYY
jgi:hypothetical protein